MEAWIGKTSQRLGRRALAAALLAGASLAGAAIGTVSAASGTPQDTTSTMTPAQVQVELQSLQAEVAALKAKQRQTEENVQDAAQVKAIVQAVLKNSETQSQSAGHQLQAGYDNGFYIQTADKNFKFQFNGYFQYRYVFGAYQPVQAVGTAASPHGDANGFGFRYARLIFSGNVFSPRLTYFIQSDFAGGNGSSNNDFFAEKDLWVAYKFTHWLQVKGGSYLVPFTHVEYISSGLEMVDFNSVEWPFDPTRAMGASVYGDIIPNKLNYEFMVNNGANTNGDGGPTGGALDNRLGFATRWQIGTRISDFAMEPDLRWSKHLQWMLGVAFDFDSQTHNAGAFPNPQSTDIIAGLVNPQTGNYLGNFVPTGNIYRATADWQMHYRGLAFSPVLFYQDENDAPGAAPGTPSNPGSLQEIYGKSSVQQLAYYLQAGYFIVPHKWELAASYGQMYQLGENTIMTAYEAGVNYYIIGNNVKLQLDEIYTPRAAFTSQFAETYVNNANYVTELQLQVKF
ncbi:MAG: hypothetical protein ACP5I8_01130 [Phycisphaerae bacterium]